MINGSWEISIKENDNEMRFDDIVWYIHFIDGLESDSDVVNKYLRLLYPRSDLLTGILPFGSNRSKYSSEL